MLVEKLTSPSVEMLVYIPEEEVAELSVELPRTPLLVLVEVLAEKLVELATELL